MASMASSTGSDTTILPPPVSLLDQLLAYLAHKPATYYGIQTQHLGVGLTALCVRWGSYLATLMDPATPLHPDLPTAAMGSVTDTPYSMICDSEMHRMNIEISANLAQIGSMFREADESPDGPWAFFQLLGKAHHYLPMPQQSVLDTAPLKSGRFSVLRRG